MKNILLSTLAVFSVGVLAVGCGGGSDDNGNIRLSGLINRPLQFGSDAGTPITANQPFIVLDLEKPAAAQQVASGTTDSEGSYDVTIQETAAAAVISSIQSPLGAFRVAGLIVANRSTSSAKSIGQKDFNEVTDVACEAGLTALGAASISATDITEERIANLEAAAQIEVSSGQVDVLDPNSVTAAAIRALLATNNGANPPAATPN